MNITALMIALLGLMALAKNSKKPVFGQLTLTGEKALDWLKSADAEAKEGIVFQVVKIRLVMTDTLLSEGWNVPDWKPPRVWTALLTLEEAFANPIWVHQASAVQGIEHLCAEWEAQGAEVDDKTHTVSFGEPVTLRFNRGKGTFARYKVSQD